MEVNNFSEEYAAVSTKTLKMFNIWRHGTISRRPYALCMTMKVPSLLNVILPVETSGRTEDQVFWDVMSC
jgi:hypothetical protein